MAVVLAALVSGLFGTVVRSPTMPVCQVGKPCSAPAAGVTLAFVRGGRTVRSVVTTKTGSYRVLLPPGLYSVRVVPRPTIGRGIEPATVTVRVGAVARRDFSLDTGIR